MQLVHRLRETLINCLCGILRWVHGTQKPRHINRIVEVASAAQRSDSPAQAINKGFLSHKLVLCVLTLWLITLTGCNGNSIPNIPPPSELAQQGFASPGIPRITAEELKIMYENKESVVLLDVRPQSQYLTGYIPGARNIPGDLWEEESSFSAIAALPDNKLIITYCDCLDDGESAIAAERLMAFGYDNVRILWKGIYHWQDIGGEVRE